MILYTCAFAYHADSVLLIRKAKPDWQKGLLNGIGGKVELVNDNLQEDIVTATKREFYEETGLWGHPIEPQFFTSLLWPEYLSHTNWPCVYFSGFTLDKNTMYEAVRNTTNAVEPCVIVKLDSIPKIRHELMPNLPFLLEMGRYMTQCTAQERKLRQPVVPSPVDWAEWIEHGANVA